MSQKRRAPKQRRRQTSLPPMTKWPRKKKYGRHGRHFNNRHQGFVWDLED